jgi:hypothetical protein
MKLNLKKISKLVLATGFLFLTTASFGQTEEWPETYGQGTINTSYCVTIDTTQPLQEFYKIDISHLNFATATDAQKVFGAISNNRLTYRVDFANHAAYLKVHADRTTTPQDVIWWNNYIDGLCQN